MDLLGEELCLTAFENNRLGCEELIARGARVNHQTRYVGRTPLMEAIRGNAQDCVDLLSPVSDKSLKDFLGESALQWAVKMDRMNCIGSIMTPEGCREKGNQGWDPLTMAAARGNISMMRVLVTYSDLESRTSSDESALDIALWFGRGDMAVALLPYFDPTRKNKLGISAWDYDKHLNRPHTHAATLQMKAHWLAHQNALELKESLNVILGTPSTEDDLRQQTPGIRI